MVAGPNAAYTNWDTPTADPGGSYTIRICYSASTASTEDPPVSQQRRLQWFLDELKNSDGNKPDWARRRA